MKPTQGKAIHPSWPCAPSGTHLVVPRLWPKFQQCVFAKMPPARLVRLLGIPVIALVGNDAGWSQIAREQVKMLQDDWATVQARSAYHEVVVDFGARGLQVQRLADLQPALAQARAWARQGQAVLVKVWLDKTGFRQGSLSL